MEMLYEEPGNGFIGLTFNQELGVYVMHIDCKSWSKSEFIRYQKNFKLVCDTLKKRGIKEVYGLCKDLKAVKFNKMFGATVVNGMAELDDGSYQILMKMEM